MPEDTDFKRREAEIEKCRREIEALRERIKKLAPKRGYEHSEEEGTKPSPKRPS
jgi:hypothetical protein